MEIEEIKPIHFLFYRTETTVSELHSFIENDIATELQREAITHGMKITGPVYWNYFDFDGNPGTSFMLDISVPVNEVKDYQGDFQLKRAKPFKCVSAVHRGPWTEIPQTYARIFQFINEQNLQPNARNREIYINVDLAYPEANITNIQVGIN